MYPATHDRLHANIARLWAYDSLVSFVRLSTAAGGTDGIRATRITRIFLRGNDRRSVGLSAPPITTHGKGRQHVHSNVDWLPPRCAALIRIP
ncbi:hypothetical protein ALC56_07639 [Trachymyrmex septentrionalis]|uniref:Uncharacterized protein n=1 Tax=Trachymyrmex septentrionalis TaxID=34720 RepID=A0A195FBL4_9HYME|nr:hypothetical protein ALC56_07639 [Trachymyrmex septentrionalis]